VSLDVISTRISPVQQEYGVGTTQIILSSSPPFPCYTASQPLMAEFYNLVGGSKHVWVIWDMTAVPQDAEIIGVEIEHWLEPFASNPTGIRLQYRSLGSTYLPPPDCWAAENELYASMVYADVEMGTEAGTRRCALGGGAVPDAAGTVRARGHFSLWIVAAGGYGRASVPGWSAGGPVLIVTWKAPIAVEQESWSTIKTRIANP